MQVMTNSLRLAESSGVMAQLVWADDQPLVSKYIIACLDRSEVH